MSERPRKVGIFLLVIALALYVYAPLLPAGFFGTDFAVLEAVHGLDGSAAGLFGVPETDGRPLAALSLALSERLWIDDGPGDWKTWSQRGATWLRLENLALLLLTAAGLRRVLQDALRPFLGPEQARSAGLTAGLFLFCHPLGVSTVAQVAERGELLAAAAGALCVAHYLKARQNNAPRIMFSAVCLALFAAFAGRIAYLLPPLVGLLEFLSARRHRPIGARVRKALVTSLACLALVSVEWFVRQRFAPETIGPPLAHWNELSGVALALEKLGVLLLPVDTFGIGKVGYALAVIALLLALHPGFVAARSAPRLWGRILLGWGLALILVEVFSLGRRVEPGALSGSQVLFPATLVMAVGSAIAATAIHGLRRTLIPAMVCLAFGLLGRGHARPFEKAADFLTDTQRELTALAQEQNWRGNFFLLDPPREVAGVPSTESALQHLLHPLFLNEIEEPPRRQPWVGGGNQGALALYSAQPEFRRHCQRGLTVLGAEGAVQFAELAAEEDAELAEGERRVELSSFPSVTRPLILEGEAGGELSPFAALAYRNVRLSLPNFAGDRDAGPPVLRWKSRSGISANKEVFGLWRQREDGVWSAVFDLSHAPGWLLAGEIEGLWLPGSVGQEQEAVLDRGPEALPPEVVPRQVGTGWVFDVARVPWPDDLEQPGWFLELLDLDRLTYTEYGLGESERGRLSAPGLAAWADNLLATDGGPLVWRLEARIDGVPLARAEGRRELAP